jgi:hypothetical protein
MASTDNPFHWPQFYEHVFGQGPLPGMNGYDAISDSYLNDPDGLSDLLPGNEYNFIIVPSKRRKATCIHMGAIVDEKLIGIYGSRRASPLLEIDLTDAARPMTLEPTSTRSNDKTAALPSIEDFQILNDITASLSSVVGPSNIPLTDIERWPSSMWTHPVIFGRTQSSSLSVFAQTVMQKSIQQRTQ